MAPPDPERLYTSLIFSSSRKYPSWDPEVKVRLGDYGRITQGKKVWWHTLAWWTKGRQGKGRWVKEGNVYDEGYAERYNIPKGREWGTSAEAETGIEVAETVAEENGAQGIEAKANKGEEKKEEDKEEDRNVMWVTSKTVKQVGGEAEVGGGVPLAQAKVSASFEFSSGRGAILAMQNESISTIEPAGKLLSLLEAPELRGKVVVSEVHRCSSYARYLAFDGAKKVGISLGADVPAAGPAAVTAKAEAKWSCDAKAGNFKSKVGMRRTGKGEKGVKGWNGGEREFYPLFRLVTVEEREGEVSSGLRNAVEIIIGLPTAKLPWNVEEDEGKDVQDDVQVRDDFAVPAPDA